MRTLKKNHAIRALVLAFVLTGSVVRGSGAVAADAAGTDAQRNRQFQRAEALYLSGRVAEASAAYQKLTQQYPQDARAWLKYGNTLMRAGKHDEAVSAFQTSLQNDGSQGGAALNLAIARLSQARDALTVALERSEDGTPQHSQAQTLQQGLHTLLGGEQTQSDAPKAR